MPPHRALAAITLGLSLVLCAALAAPPARAEATQVTVRVLARDAKFIGTSMGGMRVTLRDVDTGKVLAQGVTSGGTGNTGRIMREPRARGAGIATPDAASFTATLDLERPRRVEVTAEGPLGHPRATAKASAVQWVVPGKDLTGGDGWVLELPGFVVEVSEPAPELKLQGLPQSVPIRVHVTMMCGCPIEPGGLWDANAYEVRAVVRREGKEASELPLAYAGKTSDFAADLKVDQPGTYDVLIYAFDPKTGNTGLDRTVFTVSR